jgi:hypothetical protein
MGLDGSQKESIRKSAEALVRSFKDITPEQEYYIGRAVGATILDKYLEFRYKDETRNFVPKEILSHFGQEFSVKEASVYLA